MSIWKDRSLRSSTLLRVMLVIGFTGLPSVGCNRASLNLPVSAQVPAKTIAGVQTSFADVISRVAPAVVIIETQTRARAPKQFPFMNDPFFRQFFGNRGRCKRRRSARWRSVQE